ncbi:hypothetical protein PFISCL1PPCAC_2708, partial [Pristionchus fissidentatus]
VVLDDSYLLNYQMIFEKCATLHTISISTNKFNTAIKFTRLVKFILALKPQCLNIFANRIPYGTFDDDFIIRFASLATQFNYSMTIRSSGAYPTFSPSINILPILSRFSTFSVTSLILNVDWLIPLFKV